MIRLICLYANSSCANKFNASAKNTLLLKKQHLYLASELNFKSEVLIYTQSSGGKSQTCEKGMTNATPKD